MATSSEELWPRLSAEARLIPESVSTGNMVRHLTGRYSLLEVRTEGAGLGKYVVESRLVLQGRPLAPDTAVARWRQVVEPIEGVLVVWREGPLYGKLQIVRGKAKMRYLRGSYRPAQWLTLYEVDQDHADLTYSLDDPRPIFHVTAISDSGHLVGRWASGGYLAAVTETAVGRLIEKEQGYFSLGGIRRSLRCRLTSACS